MSAAINDKQNLACLLACLLVLFIMPAASLWMYGHKIAGIITGCVCLFAGIVVIVIEESY